MSIANSLNLVGRTTFVNELKYPLSFGAFMLCIRPKDKIIPKYLYFCLNSHEARQFYLKEARTTTNISNLAPYIVQNIHIPLPSLEQQKKIVAEIEGYQRMIDGAKQVVDTYKPHIDIKEEWKVVKLGEVSETKKGKSITKSIVKAGSFPVIAGGKISPYNIQCKNTL